MRILSALLVVIALLLPFVGVGLADGPMPMPQKLLASGVLVIIALLVALLGKRSAS